MKVAIMTQPLGKNFGGIMQAWALQQVLKRMGYDPVTINRIPEEKNAMYRAARQWHRAFKKGIGQRKTPINFERHFPSILENTNAFIHREISVSDELDSTRKLKAHFSDNEYHAVVVGSDQTWRPKYSPNIYNFFLDFLEDKSIKRLSYAASFGVDHWEFSATEQRKAAELISRFDAVSVREESGVKLCQKYLNVDAVHVLDPTLLLDREDYKLLAGESGDLGEQSWVCTYFLDEDHRKSEVSRKVSSKLGLPIYRNQAKSSIYQQTSSNIGDYVLPKVETWLSGFINAEVVLTDSFHGVVFSIILGKKFIAFRNENRGLARFDSLARQLDLPDACFVDLEKEEFSLSTLDRFVLPGDIDSRLMRLRERSLAFLSTTIN